MAKPSPWVFSQLGGERKRLTLAGYDAPFGRPRQQPVVTDGVAIRHYTVYKAGNAKPTRHLFGRKFEPWDLHGRFMDSYGGPGHATARADFLKQFVDDQQELAISWGGVVSVRGFFESVQLDRESPAEIAWRLVVLIDQDNYLTVPTQDVAGLAPRDLSAQIAAALEEVVKVTSTPNLAFGSLDALTDIVDDINGATAQLGKIAEQMDSFEKELVGNIRRFRSAIHQVGTACRRMKSGIDNTRSDSAMQAQGAKEELEWAEAQAAAAVALLKVFLMLADADRRALLAERGKVKGTYTASTGDTWESISANQYQSGARANDIRAANGIPSGASPVPGTTYQIPI